ncbi:MAG: Sip1-related alpha-galactosidase [Paludibacter sp.]|nr:Sip1-related alpha-galactosidase [Paludibacter sp.]
MKSITIFILTAFSIYLSAAPIDLRKAGDYGLIFSEEQTFQPDNKGILSDQKLLLPSYEKGIFTSTDKSYDGTLPPSHINRSLPWFFTADTYNDLFKPRINPHAVFLEIKLKDGRSMALLPMANPLSVCYIFADTEKGFLLRHATYGTDSFTGKVPLLAWAIADTPTEASYKLFEYLSKEKTIAKTFRLRSQKSYPEPFSYLGWCSWEEYRTNINEALLVKAAQDLKKSEVPVRFMLIDDGHQERTNTKVGKNNNRTLTSFNTDPELFPNGYGKILAERDTASLKWFGLWLNMHGYWQGFTKDNNGFGELNDCLREVPSNGLYMPKNDKDKIVRLYQHYFEPSLKAGFDFLKIDWQTSGMMLTNGTENPAQQAWLTSRMVDSITAKQYPYTIMNCMAQNNVVLLNTLNSNSTRTSIDYKLNNLTMAREHILQSFQNAVYMGPTVWGDHDMFHSSDSICGELMALSKAISGGPVYLSDAPDRIINENVMPLCFSNGKLLRPLAPGTTLPKSYYSSPLSTQELYFVAAPLHNKAVSIVAYNLYEKSATFESSITPEDYIAASATIQGLPDQWKVPVEGLFAYNYFEQKGQPLIKEIPVKVTGFNHCYYQLSPIVNGWSVVGATQKYLCSEAVENIVYTKKTVSFDLIEGGEFAVYLAEGKPVADNIKFISLGNGLWKGVVAKASAEQRIKVVVRKK